MPVMASPKRSFSGRTPRRAATTANPSTDYVSQSPSVHGHNGDFVDGGSLAAPTDSDRRRTPGSAGDTAGFRQPDAAFYPVTIRPTSGRRASQRRQPAWLRRAA